MSASYPELIIVNGVILTMDEALPQVEAVAVQGENITAVGSSSQILTLGRPGTQIIDLGGKTLLPGFIDSHAHWIGDRNVADHSTATEAINAALSYGWTSVSELFVSQERLDELRTLDQSGSIRVRVNAYLPLNWRSDRFGNWYQAYQPRQEFSSKLRIAGVKAFIDNGPGIGYSGRNYWFNQSELDAMLLEAHRAGFQIAVHSIVDNATDMVLNSFETILGGQSNQAYRYRIEHLIMLRDDQIQRMHNLGIIASIQLPWLTSDWTDEILNDPGPGLAHLVGRWRDLLNSGVQTIGGTDHPWTLSGTVGPSMKAVYEAVTRIGEQGKTPADWMLNQTITVDQALHLITVHAAYGTFQENVKGSIKVGKLADFAALSENPLTTATPNLLTTNVLMTIVGGSVEYCASGQQTMCQGSTIISISLNPPSLLILAVTAAVLAWRPLRLRRRSLRRRDHA